MPKHQIGGHSIVPEVLKVISTNFGKETYTSTFLSEIYHGASARNGGGADVG